MRLLPVLTLLLSSSPSLAQEVDNNFAFGQLLLAYYSGIGADTVGSGGINALALAFFSPGALANGANCNFTDLNTPCLKPAAGAGPSLGLKWVTDLVTQTRSGLSSNTSPSRNGMPTYFFSFGGQSEGGAAWDTIFGDATRAAAFGRNAANLVVAMDKHFSGNSYFGIDLDVEETRTTLPRFSDFLSAFRAIAPYSKFPLMMCSLSGLAGSGNPDNYKVALLTNYGPSKNGVNYLNMMVNNVESSCTQMSAFWRDPALNFLPASSKMLGIWGINLAAWILKNPGCTDGTNPLYPWMKQNGVGVAIWQWWSGDTSPVKAVLTQVRSG